jgi:hypothetical protein
MNRDTSPKLSNSSNNLDFNSESSIDADTLDKDIDKDIKQEDSNKGAKIKPQLNSPFEITKVSVRVRKCLIDYCCEEISSRVLVSVGLLSVSSTIVSNSPNYSLKFGVNDFSLLISNKLIHNVEFEQSPLDVMGNFTNITTNQDIYSDNKSILKGGRNNENDNKKPDNFITLDYDRFIDAHGFVQLATVDHLDNTITFVDKDAHKNNNIALILKLAMGQCCVYACVDSLEVLSNTVNQWFGDFQSSMKKKETKIEDVDGDDDDSDDNKDKYKDNEDNNIVDDNEDVNIKEINAINIPIKKLNNNYINETNVMNSIDKVADEVIVRDPVTNEVIKKSSNRLATINNHQSCDLKNKNSFQFEKKVAINPSWMNSINENAFLPSSTSGDNDNRISNSSKFLSTNIDSKSNNNIDNNNINNNNNNNNNDTNKTGLGLNIIDDFYSYNSDGDEGDRQYESIKRVSNSNNSLASSMSDGLQTRCVVYQTPLIAHILTISISIGGFLIMMMIVWYMFAIFILIIL